MYDFWTVFVSFIQGFIVFEPFYILVASAFVYGIVSFIRYLIGGCQNDRYSFPLRGSGSFLRPFAGRDYRQYREASEIPFGFAQVA